MEAVLFDWGETLITIPGMVHSPERHLACLEQVYFEPAADGARALSDYGVPWPRLREAYIEAARAHMAQSHRTRREHRFEDRLRQALALAGVAEPPPETELAGLVARLGTYIVAQAALVDGAADVVARLAPQLRLGVVSNYPYGPVVSATLERFGLRDYFSAIVVSADFGWLKPHPGIYRAALAQMGADARAAVFVGDDLDNDVKGPKALGLRTAWFAAKPEPMPDADIIISDLRELLTWLVPPI